MDDRRLLTGLVAATVLLAVVAVGLASLPPRPVRSALAVVYTLSFRVATDWLVVVALLAVADSYVADRPLGRGRIRVLTALVFLGGLAIEVSPFVRLVVEPAPVATERLVRGLVAAIQRTLFPTGLFLATVVGAATVRQSLPDTSAPATAGGLPLAPAAGRLPAIPMTAVRRIGRVLAVVGGVAFAAEVLARLALGAPHLWFVVAEAFVGTLTPLAEYAVLAVAFVVLVVDGVDVRSLVGRTLAVWAAVFGLALAVAVLGALVAVGLVGATTTPMATVEGSRLSTWPAPHSWSVLLRVATFVAAGVGLLAVLRRRPGAPEREGELDRERDPDASPKDPGAG